MKRLIGLLGWIGVALVVAAVILRFSRPETPQISQSLALAGLIVTALYTATQWRDIARSFGSKGMKYGSMSLASVLLVVLILVAINYVANRQSKRWDFSTGGRFSLSAQTRQVLGQLKKPLVIQAFYAGTSEELRDQLDQYSYQSSQVSVEYIDADRNPTLAQQAGLQAVPTVLLKYDGRTERASSAAEQTLTNALKKVIEGKVKKIYFTQGHGEHDATGADASGYSGITGAARNDNFETANLTLAQVASVPADASVVVIGGAKSDFLPREMEALKAYLATGGKLLLMIDPPDKGTAPDPTSLVALAHDWGIDVGSDMIIDPSAMSQQLDASMPVAMPLQHAITQGFGFATAFQIARTVTPVTGGVGGHVADKFLETSPSSWAESDIKGVFATGRPERSKDDRPGPLALAAAVSGAIATSPAGAAADAPKPETRVVVVGDSDFVANRMLRVAGNSELFLNITNWLAQQEDLIAIRPKDPADRPVTITSLGQGWWMAVFAQFILPGLLLAYGFRVWWKRR